MAAAEPVIVDHPAVALWMSELRDARTGRDRFAALVGEVSRAVAYELLRDLRTQPAEVTTPVGVAAGCRLDERVLVVPILRAGLGMVAAIQSVVPETEVAPVGMARDEETLQAVTYLDRIPADLSGRRVVVCDPMLATGGSLVEACRLVTAKRPARLDVMCLVASVPGLARFRAEFPHVVVAGAAVDPGLDERGFIVPGLGDAGDRLFGLPH